jgi:hypothetical protein
VRLGSSTSTPPRSSAVPRATLYLFLAAVALVLIPVVGAWVGALHRSWTPIGDNAFFQIRARDVFSRHPPLLGTWTSASLTAKTQFNNPGPLLFDLLAVPATLFAGGGGLAAGVALLNGLAVIGIAVFAYRRGGYLVATAAMAVAASMVLTMGSQVLFDATQPSSLLLPFLFLCVLVWSVACGDLAAIPWAIGVASLILQSYLTYGYLIALLLLWAALGLGLTLRTTRARQREAWPELRRRTTLSVAVAGVVLIVCWIQPLVEQLTGPRPGNLSRLARELASPSQKPIGFRSGIRVLAGVISLPPWWFRPSFAHYLSPGASPPSLGAAVTSLFILAGLLVFCFFFARRHHDQTSERALATATVALVAGFVTAGRTPFGAFIGLAFVITLVRWLAMRLALAREIPLVAALVVLTAVFSALAVPQSDQGASTGEAEVPAIKDLDRQIASASANAKGLPTVLVDFSSVRFADPIPTAVLAILQHRGVPFFTKDQGLLFQLGPSRTFTGNAGAQLILLEGDTTCEPPASARLVALHDELGPNERQELAALDSQIAQYVGANGLILNQRGQQAARNGQVRLPPGTPTIGSKEVEQLFSSRELETLIEQRLLMLDDIWAPRFERYAGLQHRWDYLTVGVYFAPVDARPTPSSQAQPPAPPRSACTGIASAGR